MFHLIHFHCLFQQELPTILLPQGEDHLNNNIYILLSFHSALSSDTLTDSDSPTWMYVYHRNTTTVILLPMAVMFGNQCNAMLMLYSSIVSDGHEKTIGDVMM